MSYQFITGKYDGIDGGIIAYVRDQEGKKSDLKITGFRPYFFKHANEMTPDHYHLQEVIHGFRGVYGEPLTKLVMMDPTDVRDFRGSFEARWEDDIRFIRRFLIDTGIHAGFEVMGTGKVITYEDLVPSDFSLQPWTTFLDIECASDRRMPDPSNPADPITSATMWDTKSMRYETLLLTPETMERKITPSDDHDIYCLGSERKILTMLSLYLKEFWPDVLVEWSGYGGFDVDYLVARGRRIGVKMDLSGICAFDLLSAYAKIYKKVSNRLKDIALDEGLTDEVEPEVNYKRLWETDKLRLAKRNKRHVEWMVGLNKKKHDLVRFFWSMKNYAGLEDMGGFSHGRLVDTKLLRKYHGKYALPPYRKGGGPKLLGALVKKPEEIIYDDVSLYDFSRYYPNIIIALNLTPEKTDGMGLTPQVCLDILDERDKYDKRLSKLKIDTPEYDALKSIRDTVKFVTESVIGYFGSPSSRLYDPKIYEKVIEVGRRGLLFLEKIVRKLGFEVVYYDTDGIFVRVPIEQSGRLRNKLNSAMEDFCKKEGIERELRLKTDRCFRKILFVGVKKRYAGHVIWEDGKDEDYLHIKGFEYVKRDSSIITKRVQREVLDSVLRKGVERLKPYLGGLCKSMRNEEFSLREVAINKTIGKRFEDYKVKMDFVRGALYANKHFGSDIRPGDSAKMIYVRRVPGFPSTDVICFLDEEELPVRPIVSWDKMIDRTVRRKIEKILNIAGMSWSKAMGQRTLLERFA